MQGQGEDRKPDQKIVQKAINIRGVNEDAYHRARVASVKSKTTIGVWITQAIMEKLSYSKGRKDYEI